MILSPSVDCIFCGIVAGSTPASIVYDDADLLAFMDIRPVTPGHLLIIPKRHAPYLADLDEATGARMFTVAMRLAQALRASGLRCEGINLFLADGEAAFQEVFHTHLHVFPRFSGDTFRIDADWSITPSRAELDEIAAQVRVVMPQSTSPLSYADEHPGSHPQAARSEAPAPIEQLGRQLGEADDQ